MRSRWNLRRLLATVSAMALSLSGALLSLAPAHAVAGTPMKINFQITAANMVIPVLGLVGTIDWGDGQTVTYYSPQDNPPHTYDVSLIGTTKEIQIAVNAGDTATGFGSTQCYSAPVGGRITSVSTWGSLATDTNFTSLSGAFGAQDGLVSVPSTLPNYVTDLSCAFILADNFNLSTIASWNTGNVTNMANMFAGAAAFNQNLNGWNTGNVTNMSCMFCNATVFNQPLNNWDTSKVANMSAMFQWATSFNQNINSWNTGNVTNMSSLFYRAEVFNQPLNNWNTSKVVDMNAMFAAALAFNQSIGSWNTASVTKFAQMFDGAAVFNQPLDAWNTASATWMQWMFAEANAFNQPLNSWNTSNVTLMNGMFSQASSFNQPLNNWNTRYVTRMDNMFALAPVFNQSIGNWNTSNVTDMRRMFYGAAAFNQPLSSWDTTNVTETASMFESASAFNQDLGGWSTGNITDMSNMFFMASLFDQSLPYWDIHNVLYAGGMFALSALSTPNYSSILTSWGAQAVQPNVTLGHIEAHYTATAAAGRQALKTAGWVFDDLGQVQELAATGVDRNSASGLLVVALLTLLGGVALVSYRLRWRGGAE